MPALTLATRPVVSDDVSVVAILTNLATVIAHGIFAAFTFISTHPTQVAVAFLAALAVLAAVPIIVTLVIAVDDWFSGGHDDNSRPYPRPSSRLHEATRLLHQSPTHPSYTQNSYTRSQSQTVGQTPAPATYYRSSYSSSRVLTHGGESRPALQTSVRTQVSYQPTSTYDHFSQHTVRTPATTDNERNIYRSGSSLTSPNAGQSRQTLPASARTQASYQPPSTSSRSQTTVRNPSTTDYDRSLHVPSYAPFPAGYVPSRTLPASARTPTSHQPPSTSSRSQTTVRNPPTTDDRSLYGPSQALPASARTQTSHQLPSTSSHSQTTVRNPSTTDYDRSRYGPSDAPSPHGESRQTTPTSAHAQASSSLTHPGALSSSSAYPQESTTAGRSTLAQVVQPSPVPAALSGFVSNELENVEDISTAMDIRKRALRQRREMCDARVRAKSAHERRDIAAERMHQQVAKARRSAMDQLNMKAAEIIFKHKNKVCV